MSSNTPNGSILLLGANGLLGRAFVEQFQLRNIAAICLDRVGCDVTCADQVMEVVERFRPDVVINSTAYTKVDLAEQQRDEAFAINAIAVEYIAGACKQYRSRLIHFSTDFVFDGTATVPYQPHDATRALGVYGESKLHGETLLREIDPPGWLILRTAWLFGTTGPCFPRTILDRAKKGQPLKVVNDQIGSPTYAPDLAAATLDLIARHAAGLHHLTNSGQCSWFDFAKAIVEQSRIPAEIAPVTTADFLAMRPQQAKRPAFSVLADPEITNLLGRPIRPWPEALSDFAQRVS